MHCLTSFVDLSDRLDELSDRTKGIEEYLRFHPGQPSRPTALPGMNELGLPDTTAAASRIIMGNPMSTISESFQVLSENGNDALPLPNGHASGNGLTPTGGPYDPQLGVREGPMTLSGSHGPSAANVSTSSPMVGPRNTTTAGNRFYGGANGEKGAISGSPLSPDAVSRGIITVEQAERYFAL